MSSASANDGSEDNGSDTIASPAEWSLPPDQALPIDAQLRDYKIRKVIHESDFSIIYLAWDRSLRRRVAIKEYLPRNLTLRKPGTAVVARPGQRLMTFMTLA